MTSAAQRLVATALLAALLAAPAPVLAAETPDGGDARVVVAVIDTGVNPYHPVFARDGPTDVADLVDARTGQAPRTIELADAGDYWTRHAADASDWNSIGHEELVHFAGTNLLAVSIRGPDGDRVRDTNGHGTATAGIVSETWPDATVVMVQTTSAGWLGEAVEWAADQPWIDVISVSWGTIGNAATPLLDDVPPATRAAYDAGKIVVASAGNDPSPLPTDATDGPWWVWSVTGDQADGSAKEVDSANLYPDYTAAYTAQAATVDGVTSDATAEVHGTSFSAPVVAGVAAGAVHELRRGAGHGDGIVAGQLLPGVTNAQVRAALNATAELPQDDTVSVGVGDTIEHSHPSMAPYATAQWGHVDADLIDAVVDRIVSGETGVPQDKADAATFKARTFELRKAYWDSLGF